MFTPVESFIGSRYIYARRGKHFIAFISFTAVLATALGIAVLLTILSIMNGFEGELRERILGMAGHLEVTLRGPAAREWARFDSEVTAVPGVAAVAPYLSRDVLVAHRGVVRAVEARGIDLVREGSVTSLAAHLVQGNLAGLEPGAFRVLIGRELASAFGLGTGDAITLVTPQPVVTPAGVLPRMKRFEVAGVFEFGLQEHDGSLVVMALDDARRLFRSGAAVDGLRVRLDDAARAPLAKAAVSAAVAGADDVAVRDWTDTHRNLFRALATEKLVMFIILALAIGIAAFNVVSILVVAVTEKRSDIAMLGALGLERGAIMRVFLFQGGVTGVIGIVAGLVIGCTLALEVDAIVAGVERLFGFKVFSPDIYYISAIPSDLRLADVIATTVLAALTSFAAPLYPAWLAASLPINEGLRHE